MIDPQVGIIAPTFLVPVRPSHCPATAGVICPVSGFWEYLVIVVVVTRSLAEWVPCRT